MTNTMFNKLVMPIACALGLVLGGTGHAQVLNLGASAATGRVDVQLVENFAPKPSRSLQSRPGLSPAEAAREAVDKRGGGHVLSVSLDRSGGSAIYKVKLIRNGTVEIVSVPAQ
jgi:uncharacterized membrane protein YkoI